MLSPAPHPLDIFRSTKVTTVLGLIQPLGLSGNLTCLAALRFWAVALGPAIVRTRNKKLSAMEALAWRRRTDGGATTPAYRQALLKFLLAHYPEQNQSRRRTFRVEVERKKMPDPEEDPVSPSAQKSAFKPVDSDQFQIGTRSFSSPKTRVVTEPRYLDLIWTTARYCWPDDLHLWLALLQRRQ